MGGWHGNDSSGELGGWIFQEVFDKVVMMMTSYVYVLSGVEREKSTCG